MDIKEKLLALESGGKLADREVYRDEVRNYQNYLIPVLVSENETRQIFKIPGLYGLEAIPVFLSEEVYRSFQNEYLKKHGYLERIEQNRDSLAVARISGRELFELLPHRSLGSFFVIPSENGDELYFNFNLSEVFTDCFHEAGEEFDLETLPAGAETQAAELEAAMPAGSAAAVKKAARREIEEGQKFRKLFETREWTVLISQPTKNKLLKGEVSRDDFDLDRHDDGRVVIFSDLEALENYKNRAGQSDEKLYSVKAGSERVFGADLSKYDFIITNPNSADAAKIGQERFKRLNELFAAAAIEEKLIEIDNFKKDPEYFSEHYYIEVKEFPNFIVPLDTRLAEDASSFPLGLPVYLIQDDSGRNLLPVFTARDCFEAFRLDRLEKSPAEEVNFIEPYLIDGLKLFQGLSSIKTLNIGFNPRGPVRPITFEPNFALLVYCA